MHGLGLIQDLGIVLAMAAIMGLVARRLGQPPVLGYLLAGLVVGPFIPIPVFADAERTHALSELGIVLVMFVVGLELRIKRLISVLPSAGATAIVEAASLLAVGFGIGQLLGWTVVGSLFLGASIAISSTMIVSNVFGNQGVSGGLRQHVMSVLVIQDVIAIVLAAVFTAVAAGQGLQAGDLLSVLGGLALTLVAGTVAGLLVVPPLLRRIHATGNRELLVVTCAGLCFAFAFGAEYLGYSVALGAFLAGVLVAESGASRAVEKLMEPVRDIFAAIFFVAIGMTVDPRLALDYGPSALLLAVVVVVVQFVVVGLVGVLSGHGVARSARAGLSLGQVGEFGFILAAIGVQGGVAPPELGPIVVTVAVLTSFTTPLMVRASGWIGERLEDAVPDPLLQILSVSQSVSSPSPPRRRGLAADSPARLLIVLVLEGVLITAIVAASSLGMPTAIGWLSSVSGWDPQISYVVLLAATLALLAVPSWGLVRAGQAYAARRARRMLTAVGERPAFVEQALVRAIQLLLVLAVGLPLAVVLLPAMGGWALAPIGVLSLTLLILLILGWRAAARTDGEVHSSAFRLASLLNERVSADTVEEDPVVEVGPDQQLLLREGAHAVGRTLRQLDLGAASGAFVVGIRASGGATHPPRPDEPLRAGDTLLLSGAEDAVDAARALLLSGPNSSASSAPL